MYEATQNYQTWHLKDKTRKRSDILSIDENNISNKKRYFQFIPDSFAKLTCESYESSFRNKIKCMEEQGYISDVEIDPVSFGFVVSFCDKINKPLKYRDININYKNILSKSSKKEVYRIYDKVEITVNNIKFCGFEIKEVDYNRFTNMIYRYNFH